MDKLNMVVIFDVVILAFGLYMLFSGNKMKKTGKISTLIVNENEINRIFDKNGFIDAIYGKMMVFAGIMSVYGVLMLVDDTGIASVPYLGMAGIFVFIVAMVWFFHELRTIKGKFVK